MESSSCSTVLCNRGIPLRWHGITHPATAMLYRNLGLSRTFALFGQAHCRKEMLGNDCKLHVQVELEVGQLSVELNSFGTCAAPIGLEGRVLMQCRHSHHWWIWTRFAFHHSPNLLRCSRHNRVLNSHCLLEMFLGSTCGVVGGVGPPSGQRNCAVFHSCTGRYRSLDFMMPM